MAEERDRDFLCAGEEMQLVDCKVSSSQNQHTNSASVVFEPSPFAPLLSSPHKDALHHTSNILSSFFLGSIPEI